MYIQQASNRYLNELKEEASKTYSEKILNTSIARAKKDILDMQDAIKDYQQYISFLYHQLEVAKSLNFEYKVIVFRQIRECVYYNVTLYSVPCIPNGLKYKAWVSSERFKGKERNNAKAFAKKLASEYNCEIYKDNF